MVDVYGTAGNDYLVSPGFGGNRLYGLAGNDVLIGNRGGVDQLYGGEGDDSYSAGSTANSIFENVGEGYDRVYVANNHSGLYYALAAGQEIEWLGCEDVLSTNWITLYGNEFAQVIAGNARGQEFFGGGGADTFVGRGGNDIFYITHPGTWIIEGANEGTSDRAVTSVSYALAAGSHVEILSVASDVTTAINLMGNELNQVIQGNNAANIINGGGGVDTLIGQGGDDIYQVTDSRALVWEAANGGNDKVYASVSYQLGRNEYIESLLAADASATTPINLGGNNLPQIIAGNAGNNYLTGGGVDYRLPNGSYGPGIDTLIGRGGDDRYLIVDYRDIVFETAGEGYDTVYVSIFSAESPAFNLYVLGANQSVESLQAADAASTTEMILYGNNLGQVIAGNAGDNVIYAGGGTDTLIGRGGQDRYYINDPTVRIWEAAREGSDSVYTQVSFTLETGQHIERLDTWDPPSTAALTLTGNELEQVVAGNAGANVLDGGAGADTLVGRGGADSFAFTTALGNGNVDWIYDYQAGTDRILLDDAIFTGVGFTGPLAASRFVTGSAAADADDRIIYDSATGTLWFDVDGTGDAAAVRFATIGAGLSLSAGDFTVI